MIRPIAGHFAAEPISNPRLHTATAGSKHHGALRRVANAERDKEERARAREADRADRERRREEERGEKEKLRLLTMAERDRQREAAKMAAKYPIDDAAVRTFKPIMSLPAVYMFCWGYCRPYTRRL